MKKSFLIIFPLLLLLPDIVFGYELVVVMDADRPSYQQAVGGFTKACSCPPTPVRGVKSIHTITPHQVLIGNKNTKESTAHIRTFQPDLILAIGNRSLKAAVQIHNVPIIYLLVANPARIIGKRNNITGIKLMLPADLQMKTMQKHLPNMNRLGVIYDQQRTGELIAEAKKRAPNNSISLVAMPLDRRSKLPETLKALRKADLDALWMIPDLTVLNPATMNDLLLFSLENKIPLITFADKYLKQGAAVSITFDMWGIGIQAGKIAHSVLSGTPIATIPPQTAKQAAVKVNDRIIEKMGIKIKKSAKKGGAP